jgi:voltage-gated potassium channel
MPLFLIASRLIRTFSRRRVGALLTFAVCIVLLGAALFSLTQHISIGLGLYWAVVTATTVGYGDITPHNTSGRIVAAAVMICTIPTVAAVFAIWTGAQVLNHVRRLLGMDTRLPTDPYTVIYGSDPVLARALVELARSGDEVVLVAPTRPQGLPEDFHFITGDPTDDDVLRASEPGRANRALIACEQDADTLVVAVGLHSIAPQLEIYALTQSPRVARALTELGVTHTLSSDELVGHTLAKSLETPQAGDLLLQLVDTSNYRLTETEVDSSLIGKPLSSARARVDAIVLGLSRGDKVDLGLADDPVLGADDRLIVLVQA